MAEPESLTTHPPRSAKRQNDAWVKDFQGIEPEIVRLLKAQNGPNAEINGRKQNMVSLEAEFIVE